MIGLTQALAQELGPANIRVNAVCPGLLRTTMWLEGVAPARAAALGVPVSEAFDTYVRQHTPLGREQTPADIGHAVIYLLPRRQRHRRGPERRRRPRDALRPAGADAGQTGILMRMSAFTEMVSADAAIVVPVHQHHPPSSSGLYHFSRRLSS